MQWDAGSSTSQKYQIAEQVSASSNTPYSNGREVGLTFGVVRDGQVPHRRRACTIITNACQAAAESAVQRYTRVIERRLCYAMVSVDVYQ